MSLRARLWHISFQGPQMLMFLWTSQPVSRGCCFKGRILTMTTAHESGQINGTNSVLTSIDFPAYGLQMQVLEIIGQFCLISNNL